MLAPLFALGMNQREAALQLGLSRSRVSEVCRTHGIGPKSTQERRPCACPHCGKPIRLRVELS